MAHNRFEQLLSDRLGRRQLCLAASRMALTALAAPLAGRRADAAQRLRDYPFKLGVASGEPTAEGFVIWTRLVQTPLLGGGMPARDIAVRWQVARDEGMRDVVRGGTTLATPEHGHSLHVEVQGLDPDRWYWFRFIAGGDASPTGRTRTFPRGDSNRLRFAFASCQHFGQGYFAAYHQMVEDDLDLVFFLGDYIYESTWGPEVRFHPPEPYTLTQYRDHHALYKMDPHLQRAHQVYPWLVIWDDHEVDNDYADLLQEERDPVAAFVKRRAAAYKAYYEHMPMRLSSRPRGSGMQLYRSLSFGRLADFLLLDNRQFRDDQACQGPDNFGGQMIADSCAERRDPRRSMLGAAQETWLNSRLAASGARWTVIAQQTLFSQFSAAGHWSSDGWDGYPAARQRILDQLAAANPDNPIFIGGDVHQFWVSDVKQDFDKPASATLATEFVGTSITSGASRRAEEHLAANPHIRFHDWRHRGYGRAEITPDRLRMDFMAVADVSDFNSPTRVLKSFVVEDGRPGAQEA